MVAMGFSTYCEDYDRWLCEADGREWTWRVSKIGRRVSWVVMLGCERRAGKRNG